MTDSTADVNLTICTHTIT